MLEQPARTTLHTRDRDTAVEALNGVMPHRARVTVTGRNSVRFLLRSTGFAGWGTDAVASIGVRYAASVGPMPFLAAGVLTGGRGLLRVGDQEFALARDDCFLYPKDRPYHCDYRSTAALLLRLPTAYVSDVAAELTGLPAVRFLSPRPVSAELGGYWTDTLRFVASQLEHPDVEVSALVAGQLLRLAASSMLHVFPHTGMTAARTVAAGRVQPAVVRRAVAFMDAHADRPLTVAQVAGAAGVGARALQSAFRRHLDTTPLSYLRRARLERARHDLLTAAPGDGTTVARTARRWGFTDAGRFTAGYRTAFGELPSHTLRR
jgi:AraC-like DNA-binding protein